MFNENTQLRGRVYEMEIDDMELLLNDIRENFNGFYHCGTQTFNFKCKRMADTKAFSIMSKLHITPANMSVIEEEHPLIIECNVNTSDPATVLLKHNGEIIHEWHIP